MRLSDDKVAHLTQLIVDRLRSGAGADGHQVKADIVPLRRVVRDEFRAFLTRDEAIAESARKKIRSLSRSVPEGSQEWDTLFRQHYDQELARLRKTK